MQPECPLFRGRLDEAARSAYDSTEHNRVRGFIPAAPIGKENLI